MGKPSEFMLDNIAKKFGLRRSQMCMVGDRLDTDVLFGQNGGLATMLVLSGEWVGGWVGCSAGQRRALSACTSVPRPHRGARCSRHQPRARH